ncbi:pheromone-processing carboxypeptidase KEX1-like [Myzus persicae]|uniref:pheromone-processing carboxypeptidase KEX1-like n=1 Tax=Myzus persicae TaxID=13164 RepID=UPI000B936A26|nr:pheromone-processing carboxypeptidase KEX1-like [Myzus persicae]
MGTKDRLEKLATTNESEIGNIGDNGKRNYNTTAHDGSIVFIEQKMYDETDDDDNTNDDYNETIETNEDDEDDDNNNDDKNDDDNDDDRNDDDNDDDGKDDDNDDDKDGDDDDNDDIHCSRSPERTTPTSVQLHHRSSLIDALDLAVDRRIEAFCGPMQLRHKLAVHIQSSPEINILPPKYGGVNTIRQVQSKMTEFPSGPARRSLWKRSKRRVWKCFVKVARRICFCQSIVNVE